MDAGTINKDLKPVENSTKPEKQDKEKQEVTDDVVENSTPPPAPARPPSVISMDGHGEGAGGFTRHGE